MTQITQKLLKSLLSYDPDTGVFTWLVTRPGRAKINSKAGGLTARNYYHISIFGRKYKAHRLAWLYVYGVWPDRDMDHINRNGLDNRICNLRLATHSQNMQNRHSKHRGVTLKEGRWRARISLNKKQVFLGYYATREDALAARKSAELIYHTHRID
jgi:hypothetical protein